MGLASLVVTAPGRGIPSCCNAILSTGAEVAVVEDMLL